MNATMMLKTSLLITVTVLGVLFLPAAAAAQEDGPVLPDRVPRLELSEIDVEAALLADEERIINGEVPHFAVVRRMKVSFLDHGRWQRLEGDMLRWTLPLRSPGALSISLAFSRFEMPPGASLTISSLDGRQVLGPFTEADNKEHGELWTPPLVTDHILLDLLLPEEALDFLELEIGRVHHGYAGFGEAEPKAGSCQRDVVCAQATAWRDVARSVALVSIEGVRFCSGFLVNNTNLDGRPLFVTAQHCGVSAENAASVVVMWNYESPLCRAPDVAAPASLAVAGNFQSGAHLLASWEPSDVVLLELDDRPNPEWDLHYAGWDRSPVEPEGVVAIHHPNTDAKRFSEAYGRARATRYLERRLASRGDHLRVTWSRGTTEGGSSGAPLFNLAQQVVGQLHGGYAACGNQDADWFGRLAVSWEGGGTPDSRLSDHLDPLGTDEPTLNGIDVEDVIQP